MPNAFQVFLDGQPAPEELYTQMTQIEVEENVDLPGAILLDLPVSRTPAGELSWVGDDRLRPMANVAVVAIAQDQPPECIFDGYVLSHRVHLETGITNSRLHVWGQDATWLMNLEEKIKEWVDVTEGAVANSIFGDYEFAVAPENLEDDSPAHTEAGHSLMQRTTDAQFLRSLAKRSGKLMRVICADAAGVRTAYFAKPNLDGDPVATLIVNDPEAWNVAAMDIEWDATRPTEVRARQALFNDAAEDGADGGATESGLDPLDERPLADFTNEANVVHLTAPVDDAGELQQRSAAVLRDAGWFVKCEGQTDLARLKRVLRAGTVVEVAGIGSVHSGKYFVWSIRHTITQDTHRMRFVLTRNAVGPAPPAEGGLGGLL
jgi:hypothetical protein